ncbi:hypothetical protein AVEN_79478-1 [Araneus ventricosus]|uniref:Uncharacterized protein n=1 Tax=Araneus ventricosus TaxID=182803 RepID=A0A4Y2QJQ6_ARAVE|nr:hypothetical protein AVEN_79478-1 [Araneus ventricosus]
MYTSVSGIQFPNAVHLISALQAISDKQNETDVQWDYRCFLRGTEQRKTTIQHGLDLPCTMESRRSGRSEEIIFPTIASKYFMHIRKPSKPVFLLDSKIGRPPRLSLSGSIYAIALCI